MKKKLNILASATLIILSMMFDMNAMDPASIQDPKYKLIAIIKPKFATDGPTLVKEISSDHELLFFTHKGQGELWKCDGMNNYTMVRDFRLVSERSLRNVHAFHNDHGKRLLVAFDYKKVTGALWTFTWVQDPDQGYLWDFLTQDYGQRIEIGDLQGFFRSQEEVDDGIVASAKILDDGGAPELSEDIFDIASLSGRECEQLITTYYYSDQPPQKGLQSIQCYHKTAGGKIILGHPSRISIWIPQQETLRIVQ